MSGGEVYEGSVPGVVMVRARNGTAIALALLEALLCVAAAVRLWKHAWPLAAILLVAALSLAIMCWFSRFRRICVLGPEELVVDEVLHRLLTGRESGGLILAQRYRGLPERIRYAALDDFRIGDDDLCLVLRNGVEHSLPLLGLRYESREALRLALLDRIEALERATQGGELPAPGR